MANISRMKCPRRGCDGELSVIESRGIGAGQGINRRRQCTVCKGRVTTYEIITFRESRGVRLLEPEDIRRLISDKYIELYQLRAGNLPDKDRKIEIVKAEIEIYWSVLDLPQTERPLVEELCRGRAESIFKSNMFAELVGSGEN